MRHKTAELTGALLDAAVAMAEGKTWRFSNDRTACIVSDSELPEPYRHGHYAPSTDWREGGRIIAREQITIMTQLEPVPCEWVAGWNPEPDEADESSFGVALLFLCRGPTPLIAAMRAYVASEVGAEVELPDATPEPAHPARQGIEE